MTSPTLLQLCLVLHITGFTMMAGAVMADFSIQRRLNKYIFSDKRKALNMLEGSSLLPALIGMGAVLLIVTGIGMVSFFREAVTSMLWFRIKMILVVLVLINGILLARPAGIKLKKLLVLDTMQDTGGSNVQIGTVSARLRIIYVSQLVLFLTIFVLSIFRF